MKFTFVGCSFTVGEGLPLEKNDPSNYTNIVANYYQADVNNLSRGGNSNYNIFMSSLNDIISNNPDKLFVQWSGLNRTWLYPEPNLKKAFVIMPANTATERKKTDSLSVTNEVFKDDKEMQKFIDQYLLLNSDYSNLLKLIEYSNILEIVAEDNNCQLIMLNGLLPWNEDFSELDTITNYNEQLSYYTKSILKFDGRGDVDIQQYIDKLAKEFNSLNKSLWVNIFNSFRSSKLDVGTDSIHPGIKSHSMYANMIIKYLERNNE